MQLRRATSPQGWVATPSSGFAAGSGAELRPVEGRRSRSTDIYVRRPASHSSFTSGSTYETSTNRRVGGLWRRRICGGHAGRGRPWQAVIGGGFVRLLAGWEARSICGRVLCAAARGVTRPAVGVRRATEGLEWQNRALFHSLARGALRRARETAGQKLVRFQRFHPRRRATNESYTSEPLVGPNFWKSARFCQERPRFRIRGSLAARPRHVGGSAQRVGGGARSAKGVRCKMCAVSAGGGDGRALASGAFSPRRIPICVAQCPGSLS